MTAGNAVRLGVISDVHVSLVAGDTERWHGELDLAGAHRRLAAGLAFLDDEDVDVVVVAGDLTHHGDLPSIALVLDVLEGARVPVFVVPGNHDSAERRGPRLLDRWPAADERAARLACRDVARRRDPARRAQRAACRGTVPDRRGRHVLLG